MMETDVLPRKKRRGAVPLFQPRQRRPKLLNFMGKSRRNGGTAFIRGTAFLLPDSADPAPADGARRRHREQAPQQHRRPRRARRRYRASAPPT